MNKKKLSFRAHKFFIPKPLFMKFLTLVYPVIFFGLFYLWLHPGCSNQDAIKEIPPPATSSAMPSEETFQSQILTQKGIAFVRFIPQPRSRHAHNQTSDLEKQNKETVRLYKEHINSGDAKMAAADWVEDAKTFGNPIGRAGVQRVLEDIFVTFPDWHMEVQEIIAEGDVVFVHSKVSGTHRGIGKLSVNGGMLIGIQPTGKRFEVSAIHRYKLREGKLVEGFGVRDDLSMMQQLGLLPSTLVSTK
jgi:predicted ester cyclase